MIALILVNRVVYIISDVDECLASPCHNNGVCVNNKGSYSCLCQNGWTGRDCNEGINGITFITIEKKLLNNA